MKFDFSLKIEGGPSISFSGGLEEGVDFVGKRCVESPELAKLIFELCRAHSKVAPKVEGKEGFQPVGSLAFFISMLEVREDDVQIVSSVHGTEKELTFILCDFAETSEEMRALLFKSFFLKTV